MVRGLAQCAAWLLATGAAATLSWWGVHTALTGTVYDRPRALPVGAGAAADGEAGAEGGARGRAEDGASASRGPGPPAAPDAASSAPPERSPEPSGSGRKPGGGTPGTPAEPPGNPSSPSGGDGGEVKSYPVAGGRVVLDLGERSASLVSATPDAGWEMQVWEQTEWIRVNFTSGARTTSVFCTWNGHPPKVQVVDG
ncbi:hypothetical protein [Streptomyces sp. F63]|uniref:hypothetical protein n=1 Tax=Streptomyces sp. F63 TaxID=2824887 RepID=UPI0035B4A353